MGDVSDAVMAVHDDLYRTKETPFTSHNGIFMVWPIMMSPNFQAEMKASFAVDVTRLGSAGLGSTNRMNDWVAQRTKKRVPPMVDFVTKDTVFITLNPVLIGGEWQEGFDPTLTQQRNFIGSGGLAPVKMMRRAGRFLVGRGKGWTAVSLPYRDSNVRATFVMAGLGTPESLIDSLTPAELERILAFETEENIDLLLPKFSLDTNIDLKEAADGFGAGFMFKAPIDLQYMSVEMQGDYEMGAWHQRVVSEFSERGSPPASAPIPQSSITFDRPFLWLISDSKTNVLLAGGIYQGQDPKESPRP